MKEGHYRLIFVKKEEIDMLHDKGLDHYFQFTDKGIRNYLFPKTQMILVDEEHKVNLLEEGKKNG